MAEARPAGVRLGLKHRPRNRAVQVRSRHRPGGRCCNPAPSSVTDADLLSLGGADRRNKTERSYLRVSESQSLSLCLVRLGPLSSSILVPRRPVVALHSQSALADEFQVRSNERPLRGGHVTSLGRCPRYRGAAKAAEVTAPPRLREASKHVSHRGSCTRPGSGAVLRDVAPRRASESTTAQK